MFIGHFAVGFALKRAAPRTSLGVFVAAAQFLDLLWPIFLLLGWEHVSIAPGNTAMTPLAFDSYPLSHSLLMAIAWGVLFALAYRLRTRRTTAALLLGLAVVSHWVLDWVTHRPDLPLVPWSQLKVGLGLWNSVPATVLVESALFAAGVWMYVRVTRARDRMGRVNLVDLTSPSLALVYAGNLFGPPSRRTRTRWRSPRSALWLFPSGPHGLTAIA